MKKRRKSIIALCIIISLFIGIKSYFEMGNILYKKKMNENGTFEIASDVEHKTLAKDGYSIHYFVSGNKNGEAVVFLHPAFGDHRCFDGQIDFFAQNYRVITIDLLGHGLSQVQKSKDKIDLSAMHVSEIIQTEGKAGAHIVGVSLGSLIAQHFGLQYPDRTLSLTALGGYDISADNTEVNRVQQKEIFGTVLKMIFSMNAFRRHVASVSCADSIAQARFYEASKSFTRKSLPVMTTVNKIVRKRDSVAHRYPTLILVGEKDVDMAKRAAERWHNTCTNSLFVQIEHAGHCANMDNAARFNGITMEFLTSVGNNTSAK
jgi:pimeloyl-ACP methyl ester carboxylesterase